MTPDDMVVWAEGRDQYRRWLAEYLDSARLGLVSMTAATDGGRRFQRVMVRLPDGGYVTLDAVLREHQDAASRDTADDVATRVIRWVSGRFGAAQGVVI